jgi:hypothetical protein
MPMEGMASSAEAKAASCAGTSSKTAAKARVEKRQLALGL